MLQLSAWATVAMGRTVAFAHARTVSLFKSERGATAAEYALLVALIAIAIIAGAKALGGSINDKLNTTATTIGTP
jgi:pilus assembly protein Flp/PilA